MDLTLKTTTFGGEVSFLDSKEVRYIRGGVTLDHSDVSADAAGLKKLLAGSFIGKKGNGKWAKYTAGVAATVTLNPAGDNNDVKVTAKAAGTAGNSIKVQLKAPGAASQPLFVRVESDVIVVYLATDAGSAITSTAAQVIAAINATLWVKDQVLAANGAGSDGTGVVAAVAATALAEGTDPNVTPTAILAETVYFTSFTSSGGASHADQAATAIDHGRVISARLPVAPDAVVKANMPGITFVG
ncbi:MAG: hypothetical protein C4570_06430 [Ammonifex sp.]|nr:MAG: hypothetical protein C4570_06430 [Ammonifex sp.]